MKKTIGFLLTTFALVVTTSAWALDVSGEWVKVKYSNVWHTEYGIEDAPGYQVCNRYKHDNTQGLKMRVSTSETPDSVSCWYYDYINARNWVPVSCSHSVSSGTDYYTWIKTFSDSSVRDYATNNWNDILAFGYLTNGNWTYVMYNFAFCPM